MTDIVERLRMAKDQPDVGMLYIVTMQEAADEIEKLRDRKFASMAAQAIVSRLDQLQEELSVVHERIRKLGI